MAGQSIEADIQGLQQQLSDVVQKMSEMQTERERIKANLRKIVNMYAYLGIFVLGLALVLLTIGQLNHWPVSGIPHGMLYMGFVILMLVNVQRVQLGDNK